MFGEVGLWGFLWFGVALLGIYRLLQQERINLGILTLEHAPKYAYAWENDRNEMIPLL